MRLLREPYNKGLFQDMIGDEIEWICPTQDGKEYQLNNPKILDRFNISHDVFNGYWPQRQPQWDGLAYSSKTSTLYLIEAKSHNTEIARGNKPNDSDNEAKISNYKLKCQRLRETEKTIIRSYQYEDAWLHKYYQISNRIAFHLKLKSLCPTENLNAIKLIFLNFIDDPDWKQEKKQMSEEQWKNKYHKIYLEMGIKDESILTNLDIFVINFDSKKMTEK